MISFIMDFILVDDTSPPELGKPVEKKYFNSNKPLGVCTYLPLVALDMVDSCIPISSATSLSVRGTRALSPDLKIQFEILI